MMASNPWAKPPPPFSRFVRDRGGSTGSASPMSSSTTSPSPPPPPSSSPFRGSSSSFERSPSETSPSAITPTQSRPPVSIQPKLVGFTGSGAGNGARPKTSPPIVKGQQQDARLELERLIPSAELSVELPYHGNGNVYQVRTSISGEIFIGRGSTREEAVLKCCSKAVKFVTQYYDREEKRILAPHERRSTKVTPRNRNEDLKNNNSSNNNNNINSRWSSPKPSDPRSRLRRDWSPNNIPAEDRRSFKMRKNNKEDVKKDHINVNYLEGRQKRRWGADTDNGSHEMSADRRGGNESERSTGERASSPPPCRLPILPYPAPTIVVTSEDCEDEYCEFLGEERAVRPPNVPIKNAVMMLNELFPPPKAPQYKVTSQTGPPNNPTFTMVCTISGRSFNGEGKSKKEAKLSCSQKAIEVLYGCGVSETKSVPEKSNPRASCDLDDWMELEGKNPVSILNELYPGIQYQLLSTTGPSHAPQFVIKASLNDMAFEGSGKSKKDAKLNASKALLVHLHKVGFDPMTGDMMSTQFDNYDAAEGHSFADQIGQMVTAKYQALFGTTTYSKRRVMAGIVMCTDGDVASTGQVVCVSSGTKCINGEQLSLEGCVINDSHAEIVSRRCLVLYLYSHLEMLEREGSSDQEISDSIFETCDKEEGALYKLKRGVEFHLFITTSPCGDARIFSLHESTSTSGNLNNNNSHVSRSSSVKDLKEVNNNNNGGNSSVLRTSSVKDLKEVNNNANVFIKNPAAKKEADDDVTDLESLAAKLGSLDLESGKEELLILSAEEKEREREREERQKLQDSSRGMLRSKIECGMGTVPINPKILIQTWDGVMSGDRLLTMACSDKILRWNVLGVQGALLTHLIQPIYLKSVTVGSKFHPGHMKRALYERITPHIEQLPTNYHVNQLDLFATTSPETRQATKAHDYSVNWVLDQGQPEIVNGSTGKTINENTSRLSKKSLFQRFLNVSTQLMSNPPRSPIRYSDLKQDAKEYQAAKAQLNEALMRACSGQWIEKPVEQDQFSL